MIDNAAVRKAFPVERRNNLRNLLSSVVATASVALGEGLTKNTAVTVLDLRDNRLSQPGGRHFHPRYPRG